MGLNKMRRNAPCRCGSGRKYKNCHGSSEEKNKAMENQKVLKNSFRDEQNKAKIDPVKAETARVGVDEMMLRDQMVTMRQLQVQQEMMQRDFGYTIAGLVFYEAFLDELLALPLSDRRVAVTDMITKQMEQMELLLSKAKFDRISELTLAALEEKFDRMSAKVEGGKAPDEVENVKFPVDSKEGGEKALEDDSDNGNCVVLGIGSHAPVGENTEPPPIDPDPVEEVPVVAGEFDEYDDEVENDESNEAI